MYVKTRYISLPMGGTLELDAGQEFYDKVRSHFGLPVGACVDDAHVRMFLYGACKTAVDVVEREECHDDVRQRTT